MFKTLLSFQPSISYLDCSLQNIYCKEKYFLNNLWYNEIHSDPNTQKNTCIVIPLFRTWYAKSYIPFQKYTLVSKNIRSNIFITIIRLKFRVFLFKQSILIIKKNLYNNIKSTKLLGVFRKIGWLTIDIK